MLNLQRHVGNAAVVRLLANRVPPQSRPRVLYRCGADCSCRACRDEEVDEQAVGARLLRAAVDVRVPQRSVEPGGSAGNRPSIERRGNGPIRSLLQRQPAEPQPVQTTESTGPLCGVGVTRTCASPSACDVPDATKPPDATGVWQINIAIDIETEDASDVTTATVGHTFVEFIGADGKSWTYGFYPNPTDIPTEFKYEVFGCMVHPDAIHAKCVDHRERYKVTAAQYQKALEFAQTLCRATPKYHIRDFNCTTFAVKIAEAAGQTVPKYRGKVSKYGIGADNPNTLLESIRDRDVPTRKLTGDTEIREWLRDHTYADIGKLPEAEKLRLINRLLKAGCQMTTSRPSTGCAAVSRTRRRWNASTLLSDRRSRALMRARARGSGAFSTSDRRHRSRRR